MPTFVGFPHISRTSAPALPFICRRFPRACSTSTSPPNHFEIVNQKRIFHRYQSVYDRTVRYPTGKMVSYDISGNARSDFKSVFVFPFDTRASKVTLLREYSPGRNRETMSFVAGMFEASKHESLVEAARAELSEEAQLKGGELVELTSGGVAADKYSLNEFYYYLALDAERDETPLERDEEEWISIVEGVGLARVRHLVSRGELNTPNSLLAMLAMERLREMGFE